MYDLLVLSFNQNCAKEIRMENIVARPQNEFGEQTKKYYNEIWPFINNAYGILYKIYTSYGLGEFECCDELFYFGNPEDIQIIEKELPSSVTSDIVANNECISMYPIETQFEVLTTVLKEIMSHSPIRTIAFLCRGQSLDEEIIVGSIYAKDFFSMLCSGRVKTNICYIVIGEERES